MIGDIFTEAGLETVVDRPKKLMKKDGYFSVPTKKTEPVQLREAPVSRADELLAVFDQRASAERAAAALDQIIKFHEEFKEPEKQLQPVINRIEKTAMRKIKSCIPRLAFELLLARDDLLERMPALQEQRLA